MGATCCKNTEVEATASAGGSTRSLGAPPKQQDTLRIIFDRVDKEKKGYIDEKNLHDLLRDEKSFFQGKDVSHILNKFGSERTLTFDQFKGWWSSTYTTYGDDLDLGALVDEVKAEQQQKTEPKKAVRPLDSMEETTLHPVLDASEPPLNSNLVVSRS